VTTFVQSELFARTFREGMALVEETANYLDGAGREASRGLSRSGALVYAGSSMRLTTQLMQIASWLLVMRAVREGEMSVAEAGEEKYRLKDRETPLGDMIEEGLPEALIRLVETSAQLYARIARLDREMFVDAARHEEKNDAAAQQRALLDAFAKTR
jgi:regulator of CtrA degradation